MGSRCSTCNHLNAHKSAGHAKHDPPPYTRFAQEYPEEPTWYFHKGDYWARPMPQYGSRCMQYGVAANGIGCPDLYFTCKGSLIERDESYFTPTARRRWLISDCKNAAKALSTHQRKHSCDRGFAYLGGRDPERGDHGRGAPRNRSSSALSSVKKRERCPKRSNRTGKSVRVWMDAHDRNCACGCFGPKWGSKT